MPFKALFFVLLTLPFVVSATASSAQDGVPRDALPMSALDPVALDAIAAAMTEDVLKELGYQDRGTALQRALVQITPHDCRASCNEDVDAGMCLCAPASDGTCPAGQAAGLFCRSLPANATIFASDGGLGTTRVMVALSSGG